jgi:hypothetical protein
LPHQVQQLLSAIVRTCHSVCSADTDAANAITRDVHSLLQQLVAAIEAELESDSSSDLRTSSESWHLLGTLVDDRFGVAPWGFSVGLLAGIGSAVRAIVRIIRWQRSLDDDAGGGSDGTP